MCDDDYLHEKQLLNVVDDLSHFILHEVVNVKGKFFHEAQDLATDDKYTGFVNGTSNCT